MKRQADGLVAESKAAKLDSDYTPDPAAIRFGMPVRVVWRDTGQRHADGGAFVSYFFVPA